MMYDQQNARQKLYVIVITIRFTHGSIQMQLNGKLNNAKNSDTGLCYDSYIFSILS